MRNAMFRYIRIIGTCAVLTAIVTPVALASISAARTSSPPAIAFSDVDLNSEGRTLDAFVNDLGKFDKRTAELGKKASLTNDEFSSHQRLADDLRRRVSTVQDALRQIVAKLRAAGQLDDIDQTMLAKVRDPEFQAILRRDGFKKVLEEAASSLSNGASEIVSLPDSLRNKLGAKIPDSVFEPGRSALALRVVPVSFRSAGGASFKCRVAYLRVGFTRARNSSAQPSLDATIALRCYCSNFQCELL